jgi:hypothetical protein
LGRLKGVKQTGETVKKRKQNKQRRDIHKKSVMTGSVKEETQALIPEIFDDIRETYWKCLKSVPDPRDESKTIYPLYLILHRVISGFVQGRQHIGILFPIKHGKQGRETEGGNKLGALPTRSTVYGILRHINWSVANAELAPLWQCLGYEPDLTLKREINDPVEIITDFKELKKQEEKDYLASIKAEQEKKDRAQGMSAAQAKRPAVYQRKKK